MLNCIIFLDLQLLEDTHDLPQNTYLDSRTFYMEVPMGALPPVGSQLGGIIDDIYYTVMELKYCIPRRCWYVYMEPIKVGRIENQRNTDDDGDLMDTLTNELLNEGWKSQP
jgi:hypothetical protein